MGTATRSDAELIAACRGGDRAAFGEIVERYQRAVGAVSYSGTGDRVLAEDVTQDTFVTAWRQLAALRDVERLPAWLCGIARNLARTARVKRGRETALDDHQDVAGAGSPYEQLSDREDEHAIASSLARVPETYREALVLFYCEQQSVKAVAQALGITENATHQRLARGRQHLADEVGLVGRTLERRRPQAGLAAAVLAAIAAVGSSQVEAATHNEKTQGSTMFKLAIATVLITAIAGTGYVVARSSSEPTNEMPASPAAPTASGARVANPTAVARSSASTAEKSAVTAARKLAASTDNDPVSCSSVSRHLAMMTALTQPDYVQDLERGNDAPVEQFMKPIAANYFEDCTDLAWSLEVRTCIAGVDDFTGLQANCKSMPTKPRGRQQVIEDEVHPAYTGSDESCASVGRHITELMRPTEARLGKMSREARAETVEAMERMLSTIPESVETECETGAWSLAVRRCMLASTTRNKAYACNKPR